MPKALSNLVGPGPGRNLAALAALLAGCASGPLGVRPEIKDPFTTSGTRDDITITFEIRDDDMTESSVRVEYSLDSGASWNAARLVPVPGASGRVVGSSLKGIWPRSDWTQCQVKWDSWTPRVGVTGDTPVRLRLTPSDVDGEGTPRELDLSVNNHYAGLQVSHTTVDLGEALEGVDEPPPVPFDITITNSNGASSTTLLWNTSVSSPWLTRTPQSDLVTGITTGSATVSISADVDGAGLTAAGSPYSATLTITGTDKTSSQAAHDGTQTVAVSLRVRKPQPAIKIHDGTPGENVLTQLVFSCDAGGAPPADQGFVVENDGDLADKGSVLIWSAADDVGSPDWLSYSPSGNAAGLAKNAGDAVTVSVDNTGLAPGTYTAHITISGSGSNGTATKTGSKTVTVTLTVRAPGLSLSPAGPLTFAYGVEGKPYTPDTKIVTVTSTGNAALNWSVTYPVPGSRPAWLTVSPESGGPLAPMQTQQVTITVDATGLPGSTTDYTATIRFNVAGYPSASKDLVVKFHVYEQATLVRSPSSLSFTAVRGESSPPAQTISISRLAGTNVAPLTWSVSDDAAWLWCSPTSGTCTTETDTVSVGVNHGGLSVGNYSATITVTAPEASNTVTISVNLSVEITIGTGTTSSSSFPMNTDRHDERTQVIYLASEIGAPFTINRLRLYVTTVPGQRLNNWTIRMKHTTLDSFETPAWSTGWTVCYQADTTISTTGWVTFNFTTPFAYNGTSNLMVDFSFNNGRYTSAGACRVTNVGSPRTIYFYTNSEYGNPLNWTAGTPPPMTATSIPNIQLAP